MKGVAFFLQLPFQFFKAVDFAVADGIAALQLEGLHSLGGKSHDSQAVEAQKAVSCPDGPAVVGPPAFGAVKALLKRL